VRRLALSRALAVVLVVAVLGGLLWSLHAMQGREQQRVLHQATSIARVIVAATVHSHLDAWVREGTGVTADVAADLRSDDHELRQAGRLSGIGIWRLDGTVLFLDQPAGTATMTLSTADLVRGAAGKPWTAAGASADTAPTVRVFLPAHPDSAPPGPATTWLVAVDLPQDTAEAVLMGRAWQQQVTLVVVVALLTAGLLWLRGALLRGERRSRTDALTGLLNHDGLVQAARPALAAATPERPAALLLIDLAEFRSVNDTLGHAAGDLLLHQVGAALRARVRSGDLVARLGGDEFAILLTELPEEAAAQLRAEHLLADLRTAPFCVEGIALSVDASIGVALAPQHGRTIMELLQPADIAMFQAKRGHKGTMLYDESLDSYSIDRLELVAELRRALDQGEFVLHYQPKMALPGRRIYGVEALVRWQHPTRGLLPPGDFLPLLETTGLIQPLSRWVLGEATRQAAAWRDAGMPLKVAVNMSSRSLLSPALPATVLSLLRGADLPPPFLELEITETAIMTNPERAAHILTELRSHGIDISVDDFGAGYTSLAFLRVLPVTALKIDRSLVSRMLDNSADQAVTEAVIDLGHRLGLRVIAEGVESEELLDRLVALGCDRAQGFLISRPLPPDELERWLADHDLTRAGGPGQERRPARVSP
jgi:diguanylate cyclase (GGDEF)-like protein